MESDEESRKKFIKDKKIASKKRKAEERDDDDAMLSHDILRCSVAEGLSDEEILLRIKQIRGL